MIGVCLLRNYYGSYGLTLVSYPQIMDLMEMDINVAMFSQDESEGQSSSSDSSFYFSDAMKNDVQQQFSSPHKAESQSTSMLNIMFDSPMYKVSPPMEQLNFNPFHYSSNTTTSTQDAKLDSAYNVEMDISGRFRQNTDSLSSDPPAILNSFAGWGNQYSEKNLDVKESTGKLLMNVSHSTYGETVTALASTSSIENWVSENTHESYEFPRNEKDCMFPPAEPHSGHLRRNSLSGKTGTLHSIARSKKSKEESLNHFKKICKKKKPVVGSPSSVEKCRMVTDWKKGNAKGACVKKLNSLKSPWTSANFNELQIVGISSKTEDDQAMKMPLTSKKSKIAVSAENPSVPDSPNNNGKSTTPNNRNWTHTGDGWHVTEFNPSLTSKEKQELEFRKRSFPVNFIQNMTASTLKLNQQLCANRRKSFGHDGDGFWTGSSPQGSWREVQDNGENTQFSEARNYLPSCSTTAYTSASPDEQTLRPSRLVWRVVQQTEEKKSKKVEEPQNKNIASEFKFQYPKYYSTVSANMKTESQPTAPWSNNKASGASLILEPTSRHDGSQKQDASVQKYHVTARKVSSYW